jgi:integrase
MPKIPRLKETNIREGFFTRVEFEALVAHLPAYLQDFCRWAYLTGWRLGEIISLRWVDVDAEGQTLRLSWRKSKNEQARTMALGGSELAAIIDRRSAARADLIVKGIETERVFVQDNGRPVGNFRRAWRTACIAAGLCETIKDAADHLVYDRQNRPVQEPTRTFHDFRRTAIRNLRRAGVEETVAMRISGHKTRAVFDRYNITSERDIKDAIIKAQAYVDTLPTVERKTQKHVEGAGPLRVL